MSELKSAAWIAAFAILSIAFLMVLWPLVYALTPSPTSASVWIDIAVAIGVIVFSVMLAGQVLKPFRRRLANADPKVTWPELLVRLKNGVIPNDESSVCFALVEYWEQLNRREAAFGIDARNRLADVRAIEALLGASLPRVYVFSREAIASVQECDLNESYNERPIYSERRFVRMYWLNGLWSFCLLPVGLFAGYIEWTVRGLLSPVGKPFSIAVALAIIAPVGIGLLWWLSRLCRADRVLNVVDGSLRSARDPGATTVEALVPRDCVVIIRRALRPRALVRYKPEVRWEFTRDPDMPLLFAESFDPRGTAWASLFSGS